MAHTLGMHNERSVVQRTRRRKSRRFAALCAMTLGLCGCGSYRPPATAFAPPASSSEDARDWTAILGRPSTLSLERFETGRVRVMRSQIVDLHDPRAAGMADQELFVPAYAYVVHHETLGDYLIDAGLDRSFQTRTSGDISGMFAFKVYGTQNPGEDLASRLAAAGISPRAIFFTHLHPDHVSGAASLPRDLRYVVGKGEAPTSVGFFFYEDALKGVRDFEELDFRKAPVMPPLGPCVDLLGDGSLWAIATPGHTNGHVSYLAVTRTGPVLMTGDASHTRWGFEHGVIPGTFNDGDPREAHRSLDALTSFVRAFPQVRVYVGHES